MSSAVPTPRPPSRAAGLAPWLALGLVVAVAWFFYVRSVGLPNRVRGDAVAYLRVVTGARSIADVLGWAGERALGFPLFLCAVRIPFELVTPLAPDTLGAFVDVVATALLGIHVVASVFFFRRMQEIVAPALGVSLHPAALTLLVGYPALVAHATVPLTDTLAADLLMVGVALLVDGSGRRRAVRAAGAGVALGAVVLVRPSALVVTAAVIVAGLLQCLWTGRRRATAIALAALLWSLLLGWQAANCARAYGAPCLVEPAAARKGLAESLTWGTTSARHYWSRWSSNVDGTVDVPDLLLVRILGGCRPLALAGRDGLLACLLARPVAYPAMLAKKSIGLFDGYQLQPYAVDVTPRWARLGSRPFGALAFAGFCAAAGWLLFLFVSAPASPLALALVAPVAHVAWHALFHVEARYGLAAVPFALVMLVATAGWAWRRPPLPRAVALGMLVAAAALFLGQTARWDRADPVLRQIERAGAGPAQ